LTDIYIKACDGIQNPEVNNIVINLPPKTWPDIKSIYLRRPKWKLEQLRYLHLYGTNLDSNLLNDVLSCPKGLIEFKYALEYPDYCTSLCNVHNNTLFTPTDIDPRTIIQLLTRHQAHSLENLTIQGHWDKAQQPDFNSTKMVLKQLKHLEYLETKFKDQEVANIVNPYYTMSPVTRARDDVVTTTSHLFLPAPVETEDLDEDQERLALVDVTEHAYVGEDSSSTALTDFDAHGFDNSLIGFDDSLFEFDSFPSDSYN